MQELLLPMVILSGVTDLGLGRSFDCAWVAHLSKISRAMDNRIVRNVRVGSELLLEDS